jgi:hypothetical protein
MRLIALETATEACSAALWVDGELRWLLEPGAARRHGELILDQVDRLLAEAGLVPGQLDAVGVGRGEIQMKSLGSLVNELVHQLVAFVEAIITL